MRITTLVIAVLAVITIPSTLAALNGSCTAGNHGKGVCLKTSACRDTAKGSGKIYAGYCPNDPNDVMCCIFTVTLGLFQSGRCLNKADCKGTLKAGYCPGNENVMLCL